MVDLDPAIMKYKEGNTETDNMNLLNFKETKITTRPRIKVDIILQIRPRNLKKSQQR